MLSVKYLSSNNSYKSSHLFRQCKNKKHEKDVVGRQID